MVLEMCFGERFFLMWKGICYKVVWCDIVCNVVVWWYSLQNGETEAVLITLLFCKA